MIEQLEPDRERWNAFVAHSPDGHLMQSWEWGEFKKSLGWQVHRIGIARDGQLVTGAQVLLKNLPWLPLGLAYIPKGPIANPVDRQAVQALWKAVHQISRRGRAVFLKVEPNILDNEQAHTWLKESGFRPSIQTNQPRSTIVLNLSPDEETLLSNMRKKTRQLIHRAQRDGVQIVQGNEANLDEFDRIMAVTAEIKEIEVHDPFFYHRAWQAFQETGAVKLFQAQYQGQTVASKMVFVFRDTSMHLWGGTSRQGRNINASYLIQWEAIRWAKAAGLKRCDLWGIPDQVAEIVREDREIPQDRQDGLWGVYAFKRGFGGSIESYVGAYDYAYYPLLYKIGVKILGRSRSVDAASGWLERLSSNPRPAN